MRIRRSQVFASLATAAIFSGWMLPGSPAQATPATVTLSGTVVGVSSNGDSIPLEGVNVGVDGSMTESGYAVTDSNGSFSVVARYSPKVRVVAQIVNPALQLSCAEYGNFQVSPAYNQLEKSANGIWVYGEPVISAFEISASGDPTTGLTIEMQRPGGYGTLSGRLTDQNDAPLVVTTNDETCNGTSAARVNVYSTDGALVSQPQSIDGDYSISLLPGSYYLSIGDPSLNVERVFYGGSTDQAASQQIDIVAGQRTDQVNFQATSISFFKGVFEVSIDYSDLIVGRKISAKANLPVEPGSTLTLALQNVTCPGEWQSAVNLSDCTYVPIAGETKTYSDPSASVGYDYTLKASDIGSIMGIKATLSKPGFKTREALNISLIVSGPIKVLSPPKISGTVKVAKTLKAVLPKFKGIKPNSYEYLWLACDTSAKAKRASLATCTWLNNVSTNVTRLTVPKTIKGKYLVLQISSHDTVAGTRIITTSTPAKVK